MAFLEMSNPTLYRRGIRASSKITYTVDASRGGVLVASGLRPTGGSLEDTTAPGVRRKLSLQLAKTSGLYDLLSPTGTQLTVTAHVRFLASEPVEIPMGVFVIDSESVSSSGGTISITAPDKWVRVMRSQFIQPRASVASHLVTSEIADLIRGALGPGEAVNITATSTTQVGVLTWEKDRAKAITDMAASVGAWVYFDRRGVATIADIPTAWSDAWLVDAGPNGVQTSLDRQRSRTNTYNVVVVSSTSTDNPFPTQVVWDGDVDSPTYAGPDPINHPELAGPFGVVPYFHETPLPMSDVDAQTTGQTILARTRGLASQVSLGQVANPAADAFDALDVFAPDRVRTVITSYLGSDGFGTMPFGTGAFGGGAGGGAPVLSQVPDGGTLERHVADTITHPLVGGEQHIDGRSTRTDYT